MLRHVPNILRRDSLLELLENHGFKGSFDYFYLPLDFRTGSNQGYGFINFISEEKYTEFA